MSDPRQSDTEQGRETVEKPLSYECPKKKQPGTQRQG